MRARTAELIGALSIATDRAAGFPEETALRTALCAVRIARALGLDDATAHAAYFAGVLRFIGCTAVAHEAATLVGGDDIAFLATYADVDFGDPLAVVGRTARRLARDQPLPRRVRAVAAFLSDPRGGDKVSNAHCDLATRLATRIGMAPAVVAALHEMYERWDGKGPHRVARMGISRVARVIHVAHVTEVFARTQGAVGAGRELARRSGKHFDPEIAALVRSHLPKITAGLDAASVWDRFLDEEPAPLLEIERGQRLELARAFAMYADLKSPYTLTHSTRVAELARAALERTGASREACDELEAAALLHDLGRVGVPNGIWDKPAALNPSERERARGHAHLTERVLSQSPMLRPLADLASAAHERCDGGGYPRRIRRAMLPLAARILAASDVYTAVREPRAYRRAHSAAAAEKLLRAEAEAGQLCATAVEAVLAAAGHQTQLVRAFPNGLTEREVDVLIRVARGLTNKEVAAELDMSPRTVQTHLAHVFDKIGARTRAAIAMFAAEHGLA